MTINTNPISSPSVEDRASSRRGPSGPAPRQRKREGAGRTFSAWLIVIGLVAGAVAGGKYVVEERQKPPTSMALSSVVLSAAGIPVGPADAAVVLTTEVAPGDRVREGQVLATLQLAGSLRGDEAVSEEPQKVFAPTDAVVVSIDGHPGSVVRAGEPVVTLYAPEDLAFTTSVTVDQLENLRVGMTGVVHGPAGGEGIPVEIQGIAPKLGANADLGHLDLRLLPVDPTSVAGLVPGLPFEATVDLTSAPGGAGPVVDSAA